MDPQPAEKTLAKIKALGCRSVHTGRGEPFLNLKGINGLFDLVADRLTDSSLR